MAAENKTPIIVLAIDASKQAVEAVDYYIKNLHKENNEVVIVHVVELPDLAHARQAHVTPQTLNDMWKEQGEKSRQLEEAYERQLRNGGVTIVRKRTDGGLKPGQVICHVADEEKATMIVMGTRGMGTLRRTLMGSVSDYVVHHAHCPVVICRDLTPHESRDKHNAAQ